MKQYWLMKTEPTTYGIHDLIREGVTPWEGVRNYQARNFMRDDMKIGDKVLFYHSNADPSGVIGLAEVCKESHPDYFAWDPRSKYFDPKSTPEKPIWMMVSLKFVAEFDAIIPLAQLRDYPELAEMVVLRKGSRLSVQPLTEGEYAFVKGLGLQSNN